MENKGIRIVRITCLISTLFIFYVKVSRWFLGGFPFKQIKFLNFLASAPEYCYHIRHIINCWKPSSFFFLLLALMLLLGWFALFANLLALLIKKFWLSIISFALSLIMFLYDGFFALGHIVALDDGYVGHDVLLDLLLMIVSIISMIILLYEYSKQKQTNIVS